MAFALNLALLMTGSTGHTVQLIFNRSAGGHCPRRLAELHASFEKRGARVISTECGPGTDIVIESDATHVCALGGDGTIRHVALALRKVGRALPLSVYPSGTVNLLHREIGSPVEPEEHADRVLGGQGACGHYPAEINDSLFLACASVGPDSRAVEALSPGLKRWIGKGAYVAAFLGLLLRWPRETITLRCEGAEHRCEAFYVAKGRYFAGPWSFAPDAGLREPMLHVVALRTARRRDFARFVWTVFRGRRADALPGVIAFTCTELTAEACLPLPVQADGDIITHLPARLSVRGEAMPFC
jgi:diacylglycerol kinase family enzyme